jgi:transposase InsO family protein
VKYACIARHRAGLVPREERYPVRLMCRALEVSPSGFYAAQQRAPSARAQQDQRLRLAIRTAHAASGRRYGAPMIHAELRAQGLRCSRKRCARLMRLDNLRGTLPRRFRVTTQSAHTRPIAPNQLDRQFSVTVQRERDRIWAADITYLWTAEGWLYLAVVLDLASRRVIGWCADTRLDDSLTIRALTQALRLRQPAPGLVHHSDRGVQYASAAYRELLAAHGITSSMSRKGDCWDNAVVESFFATLKKELRTEGVWATRPLARAALARYIDGWYNYQRRHATLGYLSPYQYERQLARLRNS